MIRVRRATDHDLPQLSSVIREAFKEVADRYGLTSKNCPTHPSNCEESWIARDIQKGKVYLILEEEGETAGCVAMDFPDTDTCVLERLAVLPCRQRKGIGKALVMHAIRRASDRHCRKITLAIIAQHAELRRWYESLGFTVTETVAFPALPFHVTFMERPARSDGEAAAP